VAAGDDHPDRNVAPKPDPLSAWPETTLAQATKTGRHLVVLVHGIRDFALWQETVGRSLSEAGFRVEFTNYGRFDLFRFLMPIKYFRRNAIGEVLKQIRIAKQTSGADEISIIAHSFGTYVVSHILQENFDLKFRRIIFCGSVVRYGFPFEQFYQRFDPPILNDVGTRDIWPATAESVTWGYGSAGTYGFRRPLVKDRWHNGAGHGFFLKPGFSRTFWIPFLTDGRIEEASREPESPRLWIQLLSIFRLKYVVLSLCALAIALWLVGRPLDLRAWLPSAAWRGTPSALPLAVTLSLAADDSPYLSTKITNPIESIARRYRTAADFPTGFYLWPELDYNIILFGLRAGEEFFSDQYMEKSDFVDASDEALHPKTMRIWSMFEALGRKLRSVSTDDQLSQILRGLLPSLPADDGQLGIAFLRLVYPKIDRPGEHPSATMEMAVRLADQLIPKGAALSPALDDRLNEAVRLLATRRVQPVLNLSVLNGGQAQLVTAAQLEVLEVVGAFSALESGPLTPVDAVQFELGSKPETIVKLLTAPIKIAAEDAIAIRVSLRSKFMFGYLCRLTLLAGDQAVGRSADFFVDFGFQPPNDK
jgi:hypothetical protein